MKQFALLSSGLLLLLGTGCSQKETYSDDAVDAEEQSILNEVPTTAEASASAAAEINAENAEQKLDEIGKEVGGP